MIFWPPRFHLSNILLQRSRPHTRDISAWIVENPNFQEFYTEYSVFLTIHAEIPLV